MTSKRVGMYLGGAWGPLMTVGACWRGPWATVGDPWGPVETVGGRKDPRRGPTIFKAHKAKPLENLESDRPESPQSENVGDLF